MMNSQFHVEDEDDFESAKIKQLIFDFKCFKFCLTYNLINFALESWWQAMAKRNKQKLFEFLED